MRKANHNTTSIVNVLPKKTQFPYQTRHHDGRLEIYISCCVSLILAQQIMTMTDLKPSYLTEKLSSEVKKQCPVSYL